MSSPSSQPRIAVIDDEPSLRMVFSLALTTAGFVAESFSGPAEFLEKQEHCDLSLLVVDLRMPGMDGLTLLSKLQQMGRQVPAILCSANVTPVIEQQAQDLGICRILHKPVSAQILRQTATEVLEEQGALLPES